MSTKQELRDRLAERTNEAINLRREVNGLNRLLTDAQSNQARAIRERDEARAQLATRQTDAPGPRPFRVGDRVRVAEGATYRLGDGSASEPTVTAGKPGVVRQVYANGNLAIRVSDFFTGVASPEFCTLIEPGPEPEPEPTPAPSVRVRVVYESGGLSQDFDADGIAVMEAAPVYMLLKGGDLVACVPVAGVRSVEVVR